MVKIYSPSLYPDTNKQHSDIIKWLRRQKELKNAYMFLEFDVPSGKHRNVDIAILLEDRICVLELKRDYVVKIQGNGHWTRWDKKMKKNVPMFKHKNGIDENPYEQATNTSNNFKEFIQSISDLCDPIQFRKFLKSEDFDIYPVVYISNIDYLKKPILQDKWCRLAKGTNGLFYALDRSWWKFIENKPRLDSNFIEIIAKKLNLIPIDFSRRGGDNKNLIQILEYMVSHNVDWKYEEQIKDEMFPSGSGRIDSIRNAVTRGIQEGLIERNNENNYVISGIVKQFSENSYLIPEIYEIWGKLRKFDNFRILNQEIFSIYFGYSNKEEQIEQKDKKEKKSINFDSEIPESLLIYDFNDKIKHLVKLNPQIMRNGGHYG
ncbi:MAG: NERD domain-containing protein [Promethearchaeota archaeon]